MNPCKNARPPRQNKCLAAHKQTKNIQKIKREKRYKQQEQLKDIASPVREKRSVKKPVEMVEYPKEIPKSRESRP